MSRGRSVSLLLCSISIDSESRSWGNFDSKDSKFKFETEERGQRMGVILQKAKVGDGFSCSEDVVVSRKCQEFCDPQAK